MDLSPLIFVALAVAWAVYLIPKALRHHDEVVRSRSVERFSKTMRVLARREPISRRDARLVVTPSRQPSVPRVETKPSSVAPTPQPSYADRRASARSATIRPSARSATIRASARKATRRRRNVLGLILLVNAVVIGLAIANLLIWPAVAAPAALLVAWLVACRIMVKGERRAALVVDELPETAESPNVPEVVASDDSVAPVAATPAAPVRAEGDWDMVPTTLPTYVSKPAAVRRTVQTIDLDSTGVWSSGRNDADSALAREAEEAERADRAADRRAESAG